MNMTKKIITLKELIVETYIETVCDECLMVAYDNGIEGDQQQTMMIEMGGDVEDHLCEMVEEPELINFLCACRRRS